MATTNKSTKDPVLEEKYLAFLRERIERFGVLSIKNLTGHLSALAPCVRSHFGASRTCLKQFLADHPNVFFVDKKDNVKIVTEELLKKREDCSEELLKKRDASSEDLLKKSENGSSTNHGTGKTVEKNHVTSSSPPLLEAKKKLAHFPNELVEVRGKIYRMFPAFGFISVSSPVLCSVYFNLSCFENGMRVLKDGHSDINVGESVCLNAKKGPDNCDAQYRATKVWRADGSTTTRHATQSESSTRSGISSPGTSTPSKDSIHKETPKKEISGTGKVENLFMKFGFITQSSYLKDNVFFHVKSLRLPHQKKITSLLDVLKLGDEVSFNAVPTEQKSALVRWQATHVWLEKDNNVSGSDIYVSSPECSVSSESDQLYQNFEEIRELNAMAQTERFKKLNGAPSKLSSNSVSSAMDTAINHNCDSPIVFSSSNPTSADVSLLGSQTGTIWPLSESIASILFGNKQKALVLVDVFYQCEERIDNFMVEVEDGQRIQFTAVEDCTWAPGLPWKVLLAWVGRKPECSTLNTNQLKEIYARVQIEIADIVCNDGWREPQNAPIDEDDDDEDFVEENLADDLLNDDDNESIEDDGIEDDMNSDLTDDDSKDDEYDIINNGSVDVNIIEKLSIDNAKDLKVENFSVKDNVQLVNAVHHVENKSSKMVSSSGKDTEPTAAHKDFRVITASVPSATAKAPDLESRIEELTLLVQELLRRVPMTTSISHKSTQTDEPPAPAPTEMLSLLPSVVSQGAQTVSTGPLMYTQLYYNQ